MFFFQDSCVLSCEHGGDRSNVIQGREKNGHAYPKYATKQWSHPIKHSHMRLKTFVFAKIIAYATKMKYVEVAKCPKA